MALLLITETSNTDGTFAELSHDRHRLERWKEKEMLKPTVMDFPIPTEALQYKTPNPLAFNNYTRSCDLTGGLDIYWEGCAAYPKTSYLGETHSNEY